MTDKIVSGVFHGLCGAVVGEWGEVVALPVIGALVLWWALVWLEVQNDSCA